MKIAIIGASGRQGRSLLKEAVGRGHDVTAIVRNRGKITEDKVDILEKDLFALTYNDLEPFDVIIDAFAVWELENMQLHTTSLKHLADILSGYPNRLLVVGGAGSLYVSPEHTRQLMDLPDFPDEYQLVAIAMGQGLDMLRQRNDVNWTYLSPAANFVADGEKTGQYKIGREELIVDKNGDSQISYADYAMAMIDEAERGDHIRQRFTVVSG